MAVTPADRIFSVPRPIPRLFEVLPLPAVPVAVTPSRVFIVWPVVRVFRVGAALTRILEV